MAGAITGGTIGAFAGGPVGSVAGMVLGGLAAYAVSRYLNDEARAKGSTNGHAPAP